MALRWQPAHFSVGFDGYERGMFVAQVVRYSDLDHEHGHSFRGHFWRPFLHGVDVVQPGGSYATPEEAMAAAGKSIRTAR